MNKLYSDWFPLLRNTAGTNHKTADQATLLTPLVTGRKYLPLDLKTDRGYMSRILLATTRIPVSVGCYTSFVGATTHPRSRLNADELPRRQKLHVTRLSC
jgi:hypothetical protein